MAQHAETLDAKSALSSTTRYEEDLYTWVEEQVALLQAGRVDALDLGNIAEELGDVGRAQYDKLESALEVLIAHILKWEHQPERRTLSWTTTIKEQRTRIRIVLRKNPGLKSRISEAIEDGFRLGRLRAAREMKRSPDTLPGSCLMSWNDLLDRPFELDSVTP